MYKIAIRKLDPEVVARDLCNQTKATVVDAKNLTAGGVNTRSITTTCIQKKIARPKLGTSLL